MRNTSKIIFFICFVFYFSKTYAQRASSAPGFGEGIVSINLYTFAPNVPVPEDPDAIPPISKFGNFTYYIKGSRIFRNDRPDSNFSNTPSVGNMTDGNGTAVQITARAQMAPQTYLIDWTSRKTYTLSKATKGIASEKDLAKETLELFYRAIDSSQTVITSLGKGNPVYIAGRKCLKGNATPKTGEAFTFYYSETPSKVRSPLNGFMPANFTYNVMRLESIIDWTNTDGTLSKGTAVFQVIEIKECQLADSLFDIKN